MFEFVPHLRHLDDLFRVVRIGQLDGIMPPGLVWEVYADEDGLLRFLQRRTPLHEFIETWQRLEPDLWHAEEEWSYIGLVHGDGIVLILLEPVLLETGDATQ